MHRLRSLLNLPSKPPQVAVSFSCPIAPLASSTTTALAERSLPFRAGERRRRRLRELAGGPVGVTAAAEEGASPAVVAEGVDWAFCKHDMQMQTDLKLRTKG